MNELVIEGVVGFDVTSSDIRDQLKGKRGSLKVYVNSVGGCVFDGLAIANQLRRYDGNVSIVVDGLAASIASVICMAGDEVVMGEGSQMMVHSPWCVTMGDVPDHHRSIRSLESAKESILDAYLTRVDDRGQVLAWLDDETWFTAREAVDAGLADRIEGESASVRPAAKKRPATRKSIAAMRREIARARGIPSIAAASRRVAKARLLTA